MARQRWQLTPAVAGGNGGPSAFDGGNGQRWVLAFDGGNGRQLWQWCAIETAFIGGSGGGILWRRQHLAAFNGVSDGLQQGNDKAKMAGTTRGQEGSARRGNTTTSQCDQRTRGWRNERMTRDDVTTSWQDKTTRGWHDKTTR